MKQLKIFLLITDIGFIVYWIITLFNIIPPEYAFSDYSNPIMVTWNWSFFPLDMFISITGLASIFLYKKKCSIWKSMTLLSLALTFSSGLQAISFWAFRGDFDITWWIVNLYLMAYPLYFIPKILKDKLD